MKRIINIAFLEQDSNTMSVMELTNIYEKVQENNLFYMYTNIIDNKIINIFSEYEMTNKEYELLSKIYDNYDGFELIIDNKLELEKVKYNIIDI